MYKQQTVSGRILVQKYIRRYLTFTVSLFQTRNILVNQWSSYMAENIWRSCWFFKCSDFNKRTQGISKYRKTDNWKKWKNFCWNLFSATIGIGLTIRKILNKYLKYVPKNVYAHFDNLAFATATTRTHYFIP